MPGTLLLIHSRTSVSYSTHRCAVHPALSGTACPGSSTNGNGGHSFSAQIGRQVVSRSTVHCNKHEWSGVLPFKPLERDGNFRQQSL